MPEHQEPQLLIVGGKKRGRPAADVPRVHLTARLPPAYVDRLHRLALKHDVSVSEALIKVIDTAFSMPRPGITEHNK
jgi:hypothetical protein